MIETNFKTLANKIEGVGFWHTSSIILSYRSEERNYWAFMPYSFKSYIS